MNEFIKKLIERLEEERQKYEDLMGKENTGYGYDTLCIISATIEDIIPIVNQLAEEYNNDVCEWKADEKEIDVYYTKCGQAHIFIDGSPAENNHEFCPYCGKKIKVAPYQPKGE